MVCERHGWARVESEDSSCADQGVELIIRAMVRAFLDLLFCLDEEEDDSNFASWKWLSPPYLRRDFPAAVDDSEE